MPRLESGFCPLNRLSHGTQERGYEGDTKRHDRTGAAICTRICRHLVPHSHKLKYSESCHLDISAQNYSVKQSYTCLQNHKITQIHTGTPPPQNHNTSHIQEHRNPK